MKIAIHPGKGWNQSWIKLCEERSLPYCIMDCYQYDIISKLKEEKITHLMWAFSLSNQVDLIMARNVLFSAEKNMGIRVFPDFYTNWHFDDKISEKYLLESIDAEIVPTWVFYEKKSVSKWLKEEAEYPLVAKLRRGAGSSNVKLIKEPREANKYVKIMFGRGLNPSPSYVSNDLPSRFRKNINKGGFFSLISKSPQLPRKIFVNLIKKNSFTNDKGYVYFQKFISNNNNDLRISVINNRAFGFFRNVRKNDFRASGSGSIDYETPIPLNVIDKSIKLANKLKMQSICFDYVFDYTISKYLIVEISYGFVSSAIYNCKGYWDEYLNFHEGHFYPAELILNDFLSK